MKIFYAVQATGNGHISRAMELLPHLQKYGSVDIFLSGDNSNLALDAPIKFRSKGISLFYNCNGGLDYWEMLKKFQPLRVKQEIRDLPVEKYDLVLNDFEYITSAACVRKKISSIHFGHQASFQSLHTPRPLKKNSTGEWLLKKYIKAEHHVGLHFKKYDDFIFTAIVKEEILKADPRDLGYYTVYLPSYCEKQLIDIFSNFIDFKFQIFSKETSALKTTGNITFIPVNKQLFNQSLINCSGIISGGGFETPAEALHLGKKIMVIPIRGQYEQLCNTEALSRLGITCLPYIERNFAGIFNEWVQSSTPIQIDYSDSIPDCLNHIFSTVESENKLQTV
ncbi:MAG TPA: glycosyltransferase family protein [Chitinophagaceae bacterium]|nr:glycosyltransferase family protein [Chitinophagaceae bacterium]